MPGSTSRGYLYPSGPDQPVGAANIQALAEAVDADVGGAFRKTGGTLTGPLTLSGDPVASLDAAPKQYRDQGYGWGAFNPLTMPNAAPALFRFQNPQEADGLTVGADTITINRPGWWVFSTNSYLGVNNTTGTFRVMLTINMATHHYRGSLFIGESYVGVTGVAELDAGATVTYEIYQNTGLTTGTASGNWWAKWLGDLI